MKKIAFLLICCLSFSLSSCLIDNEEKFSETAAERTQKAVLEYIDILTSSPNGWLFEYYPHEKRTYGGYVYLVNFNTTGEATVSFEVRQDPFSYTSKYDVISETGPVLTFNSYNPYMHYFAEGTSNRYQGRKGDYEFILMSYDQTEGVLELKGKRTGNTMTMTKLPESTSWESYFQQLRETRINAFFGNLYVIVDGFQIGTMNRSGRVMTFSPTDEVPEDEDTKFAFVWTPTGIKFYEPRQIGGVLVQHFTWNNALEQYESVESDGAVVLEGFVPESGYGVYEDFLGRWSLRGSYPLQANGTMVVNEDMDTYYFEIDNSPISPWVFTYEASYGGMTLGAQGLGEFNGRPVMLYITKNMGGGSINLTWDEEAGYDIKIDVDVTSPLTIRFYDNKVWGGDGYGVMYSDTIAWFEEVSWAQNENLYMVKLD